MTDPAIVLRGVEQVFGQRTALRVGELAIPRGEIFAALGPNGSGKTTMLRLIALLDEPTRGRVALRLAGREVSARSASIEDRRRVAMVFQRPLLLSRSVRDNVAYGLRLRGLRDERGQIDAMLETVGMSHLSRAPAHTLSGGEIQRVALARALILDPEILLLDEPTANLDPASGALIERLIRAAHQRGDVTIVLVTHNLFQARRLATRAMLLLEGEMVEEGEAGQFFNAPRDPRAARFVAGELTY